MSYHVGDNAPDLTGRLTTRLGSVVTPKDITGAALEAHIRRPDDTVVSRAATSATPLTGDWSLALQTTDFTVPGLYEVEIQVTYAGGKVQTFGPDRFVVNQQIA